METYPEEFTQEQEAANEFEPYVEPKNLFDILVDWLDSVENSVITLASKIIPAAVAAIPAYIGYTHVVDILGFDPWAGFVYGGVIEGLGYASVYKAVQFYEYNKKLRRAKAGEGEIPVKEDEAPLWTAIAIYAIYITVVLVVNVVLNFEKGVSGTHTFAIFLISFLSVPAGLLMSISAAHTQRKKADEFAAMSESIMQQRQHETELAEVRRADAERFQRDQMLLQQEHARQVELANIEHQKKIELARIKNERIALQRTNEPMNERTPKRTRQRTNERTTANEQGTERTNEPFTFIPQANERTNEQAVAQGFGFPTGAKIGDKKQAILEFAERFRSENQGANPSPTKMEAAGYGRKGYISDVLNGKV